MDLWSSNVLRGVRCDDALFADAVRQHEDFRTPTWLARTKLDWAESLLRRGSPDAARTKLDWAESLLRRGSPDAARTHLEAAATALGDLDLPDNQLRLTELRAAGRFRPPAVSDDPWHLTRSVISWVTFSPLTSPNASR